MAATWDQPLMTAEGAERQIIVQGMQIACPEGWRDQSMLVLRADRDGASGVMPNLVITREPVPEDLPAELVARLEAFVDRQLEQMRSTLPGLVEVTRRQAIFARSPVELKIDWNSDGVPVTQWITYANLDGGTLMIATATAGRDDFAELEPAFRSMLQDFRLV